MTTDLSTESNDTISLDTMSDADAYAPSATAPKTAEDTDDDDLPAFLADDDEDVPVDVEQADGAENPAEDDVNFTVGDDDDETLPFDDTDEDEEKDDVPVDVDQSDGEENPAEDDVDFDVSMAGEDNEDEETISLDEPPEEEVFATPSADLHAFAFGEQPQTGTADVAFDLAMLAHQENAEPENAEPENEEPSLSLSDDVPVDVDQADGVENQAEDDVDFTVDGDDAPEATAASDEADDDDAEMAELAAALTDDVPVDVDQADGKQNKAEDDVDFTVGGVEDVHFDMAMLAGEEDDGTANDKIERVVGELVELEEEVVGAHPPYADIEFDMALETHALEGDDDEVTDEDLVGDSTITPADPAFQDFNAMRAAASRPIIETVQTQKALRDWSIDFGPVSAPAGFVTTITVSPQVMFKGEKIMATDTALPVGTGTRILSVIVGQKVQRPAVGGTLTAFFAQRALGNGIRFDTAHAWSQIKVTVSFIQNCQFDMSVFGKAQLDE